MVADASIYGMIAPRQQVEGPMDQYAKGLQIRHMLDSADLSQLQRQQLMRQMDQEKATEEAYAQSGGDPTKLRDLLYGKGLYKQAMAAEKTGLETAKMRGEIAKTDVEVQGQKLKQVRDIVAQVTSEADMPVAREMAKRIVGEQGLSHLVFFNQPFSPEGQLRAMSSAEDFLKQLEGQKNRDLTMRGQNMTDERTRTEGALNRGITTRGQDLNNTRQREANAVSAATAGLQQRKLEDELQTKDTAQAQTMASYDTAIASLDKMVGRGKKGDKGYIARHPGLSATVGGSILPGQRFIPGTNAADFDAQLETFKAQTFLPMVQQLKGMGALSDAEGKRLSDAVGALSRNMSEKEFIESATSIRKSLTEAKDRATQARPKKASGSGKIGGVLTQNPDGSFNYGF